MEVWGKDPLLNIDGTIKPQQFMQSDSNSRRIVRPTDGTE